MQLGRDDFSWERDVDHSLASLMLFELAEEMRERINEDERRIRFEEQGNLNSLALPTKLLQNQARRTDEWAACTYDVYREVWKCQGKAPSPAFLRAVAANAITTVIRARTNSVIGELASYALRTNSPSEWSKAASAEFERKMERLLVRWQRRIEIDAKSLEHAQESTAKRGSLPAGIPVLKQWGVVSWKDLKITFISDERIQIVFGDKTLSPNYTEFGFDDRRNGRPNSSWEIFRYLAENGGVVRRAPPGKLWPNTEKAVQGLRKRLRAQFGIDSDPVPYQTKIGFIAEFKILCSPSFET